MSPIYQVAIGIETLKSEQEFYSLRMLEVNKLPTLPQVKEVITGPARTHRREGLDWVL